jgi:signal transduction histidine kinase/CheY-like chemotaxis protein
LNTKKSNFFSNNISLSPAVLRLGIVLALVMYSVFGYLDFYAMPLNYSASWIIRYAIILPLLVIAFLLSYFKPFYRYSKLIMFLLLTFGQLGIIVMIGLTVQEEMAFHTYYTGLILVMLWASFVFRINFTTTIYIAVSTIIIYNLTALYVQDILTLNNKTLGLSVLLNNNFFLISSAVLVLIGAYQFEKNVEENKKVNSELKKEKKQLKQAKEKAEESDRLKSAFLANMSHEIRTPMNGILGFSEILKAPNLSGEKQQEYISIIEKSGERLLNIINDIVSISKIESGEMLVNLKQTNVNDQMDFIYNFFKPQTEEKGIKFSYSKALSYDSAFITTDKEKVYAILTNLVRNAIKYTEKGSIEIGYFEKNNFLTFYVKDTGIGIPENRQDFVFDRFVQADISDVMARQGAGLGLSISKAYVEMLGGRIWVDTEVGKGSIFYFTLPYNTTIKSKENTTNKIGAVHKQNITKNYKLLIAEDDAISELFISILIEDYAREKISVKNGLEAVNACIQNLDIDLVLMDIQMPEMNGYEATRKIREFNKDIIIIALTAYALSGDKEKALKAGCNDYITKPIKAEDLNQIISKYLKK